MSWLLSLALFGLGMACQQVFDKAIECLNPDSSSLLGVDTQCTDAAYIRSIDKAEYRVSAFQACPPAPGQETPCSITPAAPSGPCNSTYCPYTVTYDPSKHCTSGLPSGAHYFYVQYTCTPFVMETIKLCEEKTVTTSHVTLLSSSSSTDEGAIHVGECRCSLTLPADTAMLIRAALLEKHPPSSTCDHHVLIQEPSGSKVQICNPGVDENIDCQDKETFHSISYNSLNMRIETQFSIYLASSNNSPFTIQCGLPLMNTSISSFTTSTKAAGKSTTPSGPSMGTAPTKASHEGNAGEEQLDLNLVIGVCVAAGVIIIVAIIIIAIYIRKRKKQPTPGISQQAKSADNIYTVDANKNGMTAINEEEDDLDSLEGPEYSNNYHPSEGMNAYELMKAATIRIKPDVTQSSEL